MQSRAYCVVKDASSCIFVFLIALLKLVMPTKKHQGALATSSISILSVFSEDFGPEALVDIYSPFGILLTA
jgi:hypothetical protein